MSYMPYRISDETLDKKLRALTACSSQATTANLRDFRTICACLNDHDIDRITTLSKWNLPAGNYDGWRAGCQTWSDREVRFVLEVLRWEYYQHYTLSLLWLDRVDGMDMVDTDDAHELEGRMVVDEPSGSQMPACDGEGMAEEHVSLWDSRTEEVNSHPQANEDVGAEANC